MVSFSINLSKETVGLKPKPKHHPTTMILLKYWFSQKTPGEENFEECQSVAKSNTSENRL